MEGASSIRAVHGGPHLAFAERRRPVLATELLAGCWRPGGGRRGALRVPPAVSGMRSLASMRSMSTIYKPTRPGLINSALTDPQWMYVMASGAACMI